MKKLFYLSLAVALLSNCRSNNKPANTDNSKVVIKSATDQSQELTKKFASIISGSWVKADYIDKIQKTKSPLAANDLSHGITAIEISTNEIKGDSLVAAVGYDNHEGGDATIKFKPGKTPSSILFNNVDLSYRVANADTTLLIEDTDTAGHGKNVFIKYMKVHVPHITELGSATYQLVNEAVVTGNYSMTDSAGAVSKVRFNNDGSITGFQNFATYYVNIDLLKDPMDNLDELMFFDKQRNMHLTQRYTYKITGDTLKLYSMRANADSTEEILDKLKYTLVRTK